ncbi:MarR family winged helix-turn-helix transcriptional regulator [Nocardia sp. NPDC052566]|uniref:MarR family winged helix-turn-helix transcriptional regulator n=1 Tax=Nocardia sp. NPDC052566 TaxID=3364330 RepID=UPI0037CB24FB
MTGMTQLPDVREQRPLGYWLKHIDRAIEERFGSLLAGDGLARRGWQVLNTISCEPISVADIDQAMAPFLSVDEPTMRPYADRFAEDGWIRIDAADVVELTEAGREVHRRVSERIGVERVRMMECLSAEDYEVLMSLLQRVAAHLDAPVA